VIHIIIRFSVYLNHFIIGKKKSQKRKKKKRKRMRRMMLSKLIILHQNLSMKRAKLLKGKKN
jgi:hypothetical protein